MQANKTVTINGRTYDAVTGLPVSKAELAKRVAAKKPAVKRAVAGSQAVHAAPDRSKTLHRRSTKKPGLPKRPKPGTHMDIARSSSVARFAQHPVIAPAPKPVQTADAPARPNPVVHKALAKAKKHDKPVKALSSKQIKEREIAAALAKPAVKEEKEPRVRWSRRTIVISAFFIILILGALLTYMNLPSLSVSFASAQAGIKATYPEYHPDGFSLKQPVTFSDGEVSLEFVSNSGNGSYTLKQERSSWDSSAVLDNVVKKNAGDNYVTTQERGLTIYTYDSTSVWVNGGLLYTIVTEVPLSGEQIRSIATSL